MSDKNLRLQVSLSAIDKVTKPFKSILASNKTLAASIKATKDQLKQLDAQSSKIEGFRKNKAAVNGTAQALAAARDKARQLATELKNSATPTAKQAREFKRASEEAAKLKQKYNDLRTALHTQRTALQNSGVATNRLGEAQRSLKANVSGTNTALLNQQKRLDQLALKQKRMDAAKTRYGNTMNTRNQIAGTGMGMAVAGGAALAGVKPALDEASKYDKELAEFRALGVGDAMIAEAEKYANGMHIIGNSATDNLKTLKEAHSVLRDFHEAQMVTPELLKLQYATRFMSSHGISEESAQAMRDQSPSVLKIAELRNKINSPEDFKESLNSSAQAMAASGGMVLPDDYMGMLKTGGVAAKQMNDKAFYFSMSHIIQQIGGDRTGTSLSSAFQNVIMGRTTQSAAEELDSLGLLQKGAVHYGKTGHITKMDPGALVNASKYQEDPFNYLMTEIVPRIRKKNPGLDEQGMELAIAKLFSNRKGADLFVTMYREHANIEKQIKAGSEAYTVEQLNNEGSGTAQGQQIALEAQKRDLYRQIGKQLLPIYIEGLKKVSVWTEKITTFFSNHPQVAKYFAVAAAGFGILMVAGGGLMLTLASILGPIAMIRYAFNIMGASGEAKTKGVGGAFRRLGRVLVTGVGGALKKVGGVILWLGRVMMANPILAAIAIIAGAAIWIWQNWDWLEPKFVALWGKIKTATSDAWESIKSRAVLAWQDIKQAISNKWSEIIDDLKSLPEKFKEVGSNIINKLLEGINEKWDAVKTKIASLSDILPSWMKGGASGISVHAAAGNSGIIRRPAPKGNSAADIAAKYTGEYDSGGYIPLGKFGVVGEHGPEIVNGPAQVTGRRNTAAMAVAASMLFSGYQAAAAPLHPYSLPAAQYRSSSQASSQQQNQASHDAPIINIYPLPQHDAQDIAREVTRQLAALNRQTHSKSNRSYQDHDDD